MTTVAWKICEKSLRDIIKNNRNSMTKDQNGIVEKKAECPMEGNCLVYDVVYKCDVRRQLPKKGVSWTCRGRMEEPFL